MNTQSIPARKVEYGELKEPGDFCYSDKFDYLYIILPGSSHPDAIQIQRGAPGGPRVWGWDGAIEQPTIYPSIDAPGLWHGWLRNGQLISC